MESSEEKVVVERKRQTGRCGQRGLKNSSGIRSRGLCETLTIKETDFMRKRDKEKA